MHAVPETAWPPGDRPVVRAGTLTGVDLFAFPGNRVQTVVLALTWPKMWQGQKDDWHPVTIRLHSNAESWTIRLPHEDGKAAIWDARGCRCFAGDILRSGTSSDEFLTALVIELPSGFVSHHRAISVWGEAFSSNGSRRRFGSPFLGCLLVGNDALAKLYHSSSPSLDSDILTGPLIEVISQRVFEAGFDGNPDAHARRLAALLLPDVMRYDSTRPHGFTFAAQNGRHPSDASAVVVDTILFGSPLRPARSPFRLQPQFPYFIQAAAVSNPPLVNHE
jgi:hypothetical protein